MFKKIIFISLFFCLSLTLLPSLAPATCAAEDYGLNETAAQVNAYQAQQSNTDDYYNKFIQTKAGQIIGLVLSFVGVAFLILMIYAGITWMMAEGNEQQIGKAKTLIINAIIGIIIVFAAYAITSFIGTEILK